MKHAMSLPSISVPVHCLNAFLIRGAKVVFPVGQAPPLTVTEAVLFEGPDESGKPTAALAALMRV